MAVATATVANGEFGSHRSPCGVPLTIRAVWMCGCGYRAAGSTNMAILVAEVQKTNGAHHQSGETDSKLVSWLFICYL
jgi:hypothetical protein